MKERSDPFENPYDHSLRALDRERLKRQKAMAAKTGLGRASIFRRAFRRLRSHDGRST